MELTKQKKTLGYLVFINGKRTGQMFVCAVVLVVQL